MMMMMVMSAWKRFLEGSRNKLEVVDDTICFIEEDRVEVINFDLVASGSKCASYRIYKDILFFDYWSLLELCYDYVCFCTMSL